VEAIGGGTRGDKGEELYRGSSCSRSWGSSNELWNVGDNEPRIELKIDIMAVELRTREPTPKAAQSWS
jgi:hypothetical protein